MFKKIVFSFFLPIVCAEQSQKLSQFKPSEIQILLEKKDPLLGHKGLTNDHFYEEVILKYRKVALGVMSPTKIRIKSSQITSSSLPLKPSFFHQEALQKYLQELLNNQQSEQLSIQEELANVFEKKTLKFQPSQAQLELEEQNSVPIKNSLVDTNSIVFPKNSSTNQKEAITTLQILKDQFFELYQELTSPDIWQQNISIKNIRNSKILICKTFNNYNATWENFHAILNVEQIKTNDFIFREAAHHSLMNIDKLIATIITKKKIWESIQENPYFIITSPEYEELNIPDKNEIGRYQIQMFMNHVKKNPFIFIKESLFINLPTNIQDYIVNIQREEQIKLAYNIIEKNVSDLLPACMIKMLHPDDYAKILLHQKGLLEDFIMNNPYAFIKGTFFDSLSAADQEEFLAIQTNCQAERAELSEITGMLHHTLPEYNYTSDSSDDNSSNDDDDVFPSFPASRPVLWDKSFEQNNKINISNTVDDDFVNIAELFATDTDDQTAEGKTY